MDHRSMFRSRRSVPWIEKYRTKELKYREEEVGEFEKAVRSNQRHILLYGTRRTCKTSTVLALARKLFGPDLYQSRVLRLQARNSPTDNLELIERIEAFIEAKDDCGDQHQRCPPHKIILIEDSEHMMMPTCGVKDKILEIIGNPSKTKGAIFIFETDLTPSFTLNKFDRMAAPLSSICKTLCFECTELEVKTYLEEICVKEELSIDEQAMSVICFNARGSLGMALVYSQEFARSFRQTVGLGDCNLFMRFKQETLSSFFGASREGDPQKIIYAVEKIFSEPCAISLFISQLYDMVCKLDISKKQLDRICAHLIYVDEKMTKRGHDDAEEDCELLVGVACNIMRAFDQYSWDTGITLWRVFGEADIHGRWDD